MWKLSPNLTLLTSFKVENFLLVLWNYHWKFGCNMGSLEGTLALSGSKQLRGENASLSRTTSKIRRRKKTMGVGCKYLALFSYECINQSVCSWKWHLYSNACVLKAEDMLLFFVLFSKDFNLIWNICPQTFAAFKLISSPGIKTQTEGVAQEFLHICLCFKMANSRAHTHLSEQVIVPSGVPDLAVVYTYEKKTVTLIIFSNTNCSCVHMLARTQKDIDTHTNHGAPHTYIRPS